MYPFLVGSFRSCLLDIPRPPGRSWLLGNLKEIYDSNGELVCDEWVEQYGHTMMYRGFFSMPRLFTTDTRAISHILTHSSTYQKPEEARRSLSALTGPGPEHRKQRRMLNPAFGPAQIRDLTDVFVAKSLELRNIWDDELVRSVDKATRVDAQKGLSKMALDVIGLAGLNYEFNSLNPQGKPDELASAFQEIFSVPDKVPIFMMLKYFFPILNVLRDARTRQVEKAQKVMRRVGSQLARSRDLLTLLIKANLSTDVPASQRLSDEAVLARAFLVTGHETSSTATTWCLFALAQAPQVQKKLRQELLAVQTDTPSMDELLALRYLDMVVRETLRLYAPVPTTMRVATKDDVIPLAEPLVNHREETVEYLRVKAGTHIVVPIATLNRLKALWGEDSLLTVQVPERWENSPKAVSSVPGIWGHLLTFLGGPRACIGYRFSLVEMKAIVFTLVRAFQLELAVPAVDIERKTAIVQRPLVRGAPEQGSQMPLIVRRAEDT
ncbi:cytochrome P450 [Daedaleopsis nitida]|nr:cytochrome P450 [Daedaleopsis nitida]